MSDSEGPVKRTSIASAAAPLRTRATIATRHVSLSEEKTMRSMWLGIGSALVAAAAFLAQPPVATLAAQERIERVPVDCNRACLENLVDRYLAAVLAHDPKRLPLSADVKYTENDQVLDVGDGFWNTATGRGTYNHYFADPVTTQVGWMGTMRERGGLLLMTVRLRVQLGR